MHHTFHIPVLGLAYSIDTPIKVAHLGISSVASIVDDFMVEEVRKFYCLQHQIPYTAIHQTETDARAKRITAYLNLMQDIVNQNFEALCNESFETGTNLHRYFDLLPPENPIKELYVAMQEAEDLEFKKVLQQQLKKRMSAGQIDVNIMSKVDKLNANHPDGLSEEQSSDALAALRGFAQSKLSSSLVLSAGMNPRLYSYISEFTDFFPDKQGKLQKKIILKVSDFRSAFIQAKFLAKKGIWVSEFRIESGLNCGGHAFATEGYLLGPILEEFKSRRIELKTELFELYQQALQEKAYQNISQPEIKITAQGGLGVAAEHDFLLKHYNLDAIGWGSPFLLVPEATNVDSQTLQDLADAQKEDFYISNASPLGIPFNNFRKSSAEQLRLKRIKQNKPGSPCTKKFLVSNTEFSAEPICTASRKYQHQKIKSLQKQSLSPEEYAIQYEQVTSKVCLCEGLVNSFLLKYKLPLPTKTNEGVSICPGPNLAFFNRIYSLEEMVKHIYGKVNLLEGTSRPHLFINELKLYVDYLKKDMANPIFSGNTKKIKYWMNFKTQLENGIDYYKNAIKEIFMPEDVQQLDEFKMVLHQLQLG